MVKRTALISFALLIVIILLLFYINLVVLPSRENKAYQVAQPCPFSVKSYCNNSGLSKEKGRVRTCYSTKEKTEIASPLSGEVRYGRISLGNNPGDGPFFEKLTILDLESKKGFSLIFSGDVQEGLHYVEQGGTIGKILKDVTIEGERCSLIMEEFNE